MKQKSHTRRKNVLQTPLETNVIKDNICQELGKEYPEEAICHAEQ